MEPEVKVLSFDKAALSQKNPGVSELEVTFCENPVEHSADDVIPGEFNAKLKELEQNDDGEEQSKPPNGGWGWVITFSTYVINVMLIGTHNIFGAIYYDLLKEFNSTQFETGL